MTIEKFLDKIKKKICIFCRVSSTRHSAKTNNVNCRYVLALVCRVSIFAECSTLDKKFFAECFSLPSIWHSAKEEFTVCFPLLSATLGKQALCRVPDILHSAKLWTLGKGHVSGSGHLKNAYPLHALVHRF
jgi:hypothetical protein